MPTIDQFLAAAKSEVGYTENPPGSNKTKFAAEAGHTNGQPWCATFLVAIAHRTGLKLPSESAYTPTLANGFKNVDRWSPSPHPGDFVFYDWPDSTTRIQHVEVVESLVVDAFRIITIGGNTSSDDAGSQDNGGGVYRRDRSAHYVVGYGRPIYTAPAPSPVLEVDVNLKRHPVTVEVGSSGKGSQYAPVPKASIVSVQPNAAKGVCPVAATYAEGAGVRVEVADGPPNGAVVVDLMYAAP